MKTVIVVPWHNPEQLGKFIEAWGISTADVRFIFQQDLHREGCARTKNNGIRSAMEAGADAIIILDDDCFPEDGRTVDSFIEAHEQALEPQAVEMFEAITDPPSRGTPYFNRTITMPVAASMGFWSGIGDFDAPGQLVYGATKSMVFHCKVIHGRYFPLCGMNVAFRIEQWPWCQFLDVPRFDDIWQGFIWQKRAYSVGQCFNLNGPIIRHSRQSDVWSNLKDEAANLKRNETLWQDIHAMEFSEYSKMVAGCGIF